MEKEKKWNKKWEGRNGRRSNEEVGDRVWKTRHQNLKENRAGESVPFLSFAASAICRSHDQFQGNVDSAFHAQSTKHCVSLNATSQCSMFSKMVHLQQKGTFTVLRTLFGVSVNKHPLNACRNLVLPTIPLKFFVSNDFLEIIFRATVFLLKAQIFPFHSPHFPSPPFLSFSFLPFLSPPFTLIQTNTKVHLIKSPQRKIS